MSEDKNDENGEKSKPALPDLQSFVEGFMIGIIFVLILIFAVGIDVFPYYNKEMRAVFTEQLVTELKNVTQLANVLNNVEFFDKALLFKILDRARIDYLIWTGLIATVAMSVVVWALNCVYAKLIEVHATTKSLLSDVWLVQVRRIKELEKENESAKAHAAELEKELADMLRDIERAAGESAPAAAEAIDAKPVDDKPRDIEGCFWIGLPHSACGCMGAACKDAAEM